MEVEVASPHRTGTTFATDTQFLPTFTARWNADLEGLFSFFPINEDLNDFAMSEFAFGKRGVVCRVKIY
jgi:hypothetical protein